MPENIVVIDIETENTGYDIMEDNQRIISIQLNNGTKEELYFADSPTNNLGLAAARIKSIASNGSQFIGYNIKNFDLPLLKKFNDIEIPYGQVIDIGEIKNMVLLKTRLGKKNISPEDACSHFGVVCNHRALLKPLIDRSE